MGSRCLVLLSGGIDSAACVDFYQRQMYEMDALCVDYGQPAAAFEMKAASAVSRYFGIPLRVLKVDGAQPKTGGEITARNAFLLFAAIMELQSTPAIVALGIHSGTRYFDCSPSFVEKAQAIIDGQCNGMIRVVAPFIEWTKKEIWAYCVEHGVPLTLTYSCERGSEVPCGTCASCRDLEALRAG